MGRLGLRYPLGLHNTRSWMGAGKRFDRGGMVCRTENGGHYLVWFDRILIFGCQEDSVIGSACVASGGDWTTPRLVG